MTQRRSATTSLAARRIAIAVKLAAVQQESQYASLAARRIAVVVKSFIDVASVDAAGVILANT